MKIRAEMVGAAAGITVMAAWFFIGTPKKMGSDVVGLLFTGSVVIGIFGTMFSYLVMQSWRERRTRRRDREDVEPAETPGDPDSHE